MMATAIERRRQQNRLAQRRYRQRRRQIVTNPVLLKTGPVLMPTPLPVETAEASERPPPWPTYAPATIDSTKSFCEIVADSANILLGGLGTINMDDVELPSSFVAARRTGSAGATPTLDEVVDLVSKSRVYTRASPSSINANLMDLASQKNDGNADVDKVRKGWVTPLHMAARKGRDKIVRTLLQHNADCNMRDDDGLTPLLHAVIGGCPEIVTLLLSRGARIELVDHKSRSALHLAAAQKQEVVLRVLLENGGDRPSVIDKCDNTGMTPLHIAVDSDFEAGVQLLLQFGASVHCQVE